ncbi:MAG: VCBS repeat-containing protein [Myxococcota bacterium]
MLFLLSAHAALFDDVTATTLGTTAEWSNKVVLDDVDGDGDLDVVLANGGDYNSPGTPEPNRVFLNDGGAFTELALPGGPDLSRSVKVGDVDGDGVPELFVSGVYETPSRLFTWTGAGFTEVSERLPSTPHSFGDLELGDVDDDGDLDVVLADWGPGDPLANPGGRTRLWRNDGGTFTDVTDAAMPDIAVRMSWDLELADIDNDFDLDVLVASKGSSGSFLFLNDGTGTFTDASDRLPQFTNNYELAPMDVDGDGWLDLVTINDGNQLREHLFLNDGTGAFTNGNGSAWPQSANLGEDDNVVEFLDLDDDGDPDFVIGSLSGPDRALINDAGVLSLSAEPVFAGGPTPGTLSIAFGDLNGDGRADAAMAQGEAASADKLFFGADIPVDTHGPVIAVESLTSFPARLHARVHDRTTPVRPADLRVEVAIVAVDARTPVPMTWTGGQLWSADVPAVAAGEGLELCATDRAGNTTCIPVLEADSGDTATPPCCKGDRSCGCATPRGPSLLGAVLALGLVRRARSARLR